MGTSLGRAVAAVAVAVAALATTPQAASADTPAVSIPPDEVTDGVPVTLTTSGFPTGVHGIVECPTANIAAATPGNLPQGCAILHIGFEPVPPSIAAPVARELTWVGADFLPRVVDCAAAPGECSLGVFMPGLADGSAYAPLTFAPPIVPLPSRGLADGATVEVSASGVPEGDWSVAQSAVSYGGPTEGPSEPWCGPSVPVASSGGTVTGATVVRDPLVAVDGTETACGATGCALVLRSTDGAWRGRARVSFGPPTITVLNPSLDPVDWASFTVAGLPGTTADVRQCAGPVSSDTCDAASVVALDSIGGATGGSRPVAVQFTAESGVAVDCRVTPCSLVVVGTGGTAVASAPLPLRPPPALTVTPQGRSARRADGRRRGRRARSVHRLRRASVRSRRVPVGRAVVHRHARGDGELARGHDLDVGHGDRPHAGAGCSARLLPGPVRPRRVDARRLAARPSRWPTARSPSRRPTASPTGRPST